MSRKPGTYSALLQSHFLTRRITRGEYISALRDEIYVQKGHMLIPEGYRCRLVKLPRAFSTQGKG